MPLNMLLRVLLAIPPLSAIAVGLMELITSEFRPAALVMLIAGLLFSFVLIHPSSARTAGVLVAVAFGGVFTIGRVLRPLVAAAYGDPDAALDLSSLLLRATLAVILIAAPLALARRLRIGRDAISSRSENPR